MIADKVEEFSSTNCLFLLGAAWFVH